jgi:hypothetical protein
MLTDAAVDVFQVTQIQIADVLREEAYLLFYMQSGKKTTVSYHCFTYMGAKFYVS